MKNAARAAAAMLAIAALTGAARGAGVTAALKGGYFAPSDKVFRDVYTGGPVFGLDLAVPIGGVFELWAGADLFSKNGHLTLTEDPTKVRIVPLYLGLRCEFGKTKLRPYVGAAAAYFLFHETNLLGTVNDSGLGFLGQAGLMWRLGGAVWLDLHAGYRACTLKSGSGDDAIEAKLGGFTAGLGLAFRF
jgi:Outer membrane protein beta-barrel domain